MTTKSRYEELKQQFPFHNYRYHVLDAPVINDAEFDKLLAQWLKPNVHISEVACWLLTKRIFRANIMSNTIPHSFLAIP